MKKEKLEKLFTIMEMYYNDLDNLTKRLQEDYNGEKDFKQNEQDRLALSMVLDVFEEVKEEIER